MGESPNPRPRRFSLGQPAMLFPNEYVWLVFVSAMDIIFTWIIIRNYDGTEANPIAQLYIDLHGPTGLIIYKFCIVIFVVLLCEWVGHLKERTGRRLARASVIISAIPLLVSVYVVSSNIGKIVSGEGF
jgi:uncharacterized membrane protein